MRPAGRRVWHAVVLLLAGSSALALLTFVCLQLRLDLATTAFLYLMVIVLLSLHGSFLLSAGLSLIAVGCLAYYFAPPIFSLQIDDLPREAVAIVAFWTTAAVVTHSVARASKLAEKALAEIEERRRAEDVLRQQNNLLDLTHDTVFSRDMHDTITYWNRGAQELYGWTREEALGKVTHELVKTTFPAPLAAINAELLRTGRWEGELTHTKRDGTQVVVASRWSLQRDDQQRPFGILETNNDISERRRTEAALREAQADLAHVNRVTTMGELTASLAHEVNQPIAAAITNANTCLLWLDRATPNIEEARAATMRIVQDGTRAADIINRIRQLFKKGVAQREWVDVNEVVRGMMILLHSEVTRYDISVRTELAAHLPPVMGDRVQLQQVMMNLIMNSIDAMKEVDGTREISITSQPAEHEHLLVSVTDTGVGLPPQQADQIFNAFFTTKAQGTGMGLSITRSIVESHGGRLWAADNPSRGASFHLTLPTTVEAAE